jgi:hypothetical protein
VFGVGPQIGYIVPLGTTHQAYVNLKGYKEFSAEHRPEAGTSGSHWRSRLRRPRRRRASKSSQSKLKNVMTLRVKRFC